MYKIKERKAGEFIDLEFYFASMDGDYENIVKFFVLLLTGKPADEEDIKRGISLNESDCIEIIGIYAKEVSELKEQFEFIYNPPPLPSVISDKQSTIGDEYRKEFAEMYGGYVEMVYLLCGSFKYKPNEVLEMKLQDFLFWGNYLLHKKFVENIK